MSDMNIKEQAERVLAKTYARFPIVITRGRGCTLWDEDGKAYTDFVAGIAVCNLGHAHPGIAKVICKQAGTLLHVSNLYYTGPQVELAGWLVEHSFADRVFFCNSGAEANEAAFKIARKYFKDKNEPDRFRIIAMEKSFHGRTMATLSATGQAKVKMGFDPTLQGFDFVPFDDIEALRKKISDKVCAVLMEPVQGEGGVRCPDPEYMKAVRRLCDETGALLIFDEIQTGIGRTGKLFAYEHFGVEPDIMTLAKALANGLPIGAMLVKDEVGEAFGPGSHASTFGGTPLVTAVSLEALRTIEKEEILKYCTSTGDYFKKRLCVLKEKYDFIEDVRGFGLLLGMKINIEGNSVVDECLQRGFLINCIQGKILRFIPPLVISRKEIDSLLDCLDAIFTKQ